MELEFLPRGPVAGPRLPERKSPAAIDRGVCSAGHQRTGPVWAIAQRRGRTFAFSQKRAHHFGRGG
eukprot:1845298-Lingulodinium_polyedra.AAC.1